MPDPTPSPKAHSVENGVVKRTSVSAIQTFVKCPRKWFWKYVARIPDAPPGAGQLRGLQGHKRIETFLTGGPNVLGVLERRGVEAGLIPTPGADLLVEQPFEGKKDAAGNPVGTQTKGLVAHDVPLAGFVDLVSLRVEGRVRLVDWKFKSNIEAYGMKQKEVFDPKKEAGIQLIGYAAWAAISFPDRPIIEAGHVTFQTKGVPQVVPVFDTRPREALPALWAQVVDPVIPAMKATAQETDGFRVACNVNACHEYRGCPFLSTCYSPMERLVASLKHPAAVSSEGAAPGSKQKENTVGLLSLTSTPAAASAAPLSPAPLPAFVSPPASATVQGAAIVAPAVVAPTPPAKAASPSPGQVAPAGDFLPTVLGIVPPDSPRNAPLEYVVDGRPATKAEFIAANAAPIPEAPAPAVPPPAAVAPVAAPAPKRRKNKAELAPTTPAAIPAPTPAAIPVPPPALPAAIPVPPPALPVSAQAPVVVAPLPAVTAAGGGATSPRAVTPAHVLCIGCQPATGGFDLLPHVLRLEKIILDRLQINMPIRDLRLCDDKVLGFARWKPILESAVALEDFPAGTYIILTRDERVLVVAEALSRLLPAGATFRGCV